MPPRQCTLIWLVTVGVAACSSRPAPDWTQADNPNRDATQLTARILEAVAAEPGMTIADVGAGAGYFTFKLSRDVGPEGRIVATDIDSEMVRILGTEKAERRAANVTVVPVDVRNPLDIGVEPGSVDVALVVNLFLFTSDGHFVDLLGDARSAAFLRLAGLWRALTPGGRVVIVNDEVRERDLPVALITPIASELFEVVEQVQVESGPGRTPGYLLVLRKPTL